MKEIFKELSKEKASVVENTISENWQKMNILEKCIDSRDKNYVLLVSIIIFILSTFTEKYFIRIANNFTLLIMVYDNIWKVGRASDK